MRALQLAVVCTFGCSYTGCGHILQEHTLPDAKQRGSSWSDAEVAFIEGTMDEPLSEVARALNRTYYGTARARSHVKRGILRS